MNYKGNNNQCDICAGKGCVHCNRKPRDEKTLDLCDMYYCGAQFVELIYTKASKEIVMVPIDRSTIKDIGILATKSHYPCLPGDPIFWPHTKTYTELLGDDLTLIVSSHTIFWSKELTKKIVAYTKKGEKWEGVEYAINI